MNYKVLDLGIIDYNKAYAIQKEKLKLVKDGNCNGVIILAEHLPVFTIGRSSSKNNFIISREKIKSLGADIVYTDRGGDITFHGPGQLVAYPVFNLNMHGRDMHKFLRGIEDAIICLLAEYGISSFRVPGRTGCWTGKGKIASIGIGASSWISYHGMALNANTDLQFFDMINPCGYKDIKMTSMQEILRTLIDIDILKTRLVKSFEKAFHIKTCKLSFASTK
jgi:lipoyl(octanoyl) transferase